MQANSKCGRNVQERKVFWLIGVTLLLAACSTSVSANPTATATGLPVSPAPVSTATGTPISIATSEPTATQGLSFQSVVYRDEVAGFEFDHPAGWTVGPSEQHSRGGITAFTSWSRPTDVLPGTTPPGQTRLDVTVQLWEPVSDLAAFVAQRMGAWEASGIIVVSHETWVLADGRAAEAFVVEGSDGNQGFFFLTTLADKYLVLSGDGDLALLSEIAHTVRGIP